MSYWFRPFFPESCVDALLDDYLAYDTMLRIRGSFSGIAETFRAITIKYDWRHVVLVSDDNITNLCGYGAKPFDEVFGQDENYTFTWLRFGSKPTSMQIENILQQIQAVARGL